MMSLSGFSSDSMGYQISRLVKYEFEMSNTSGSVLENQSFLTYAPVARTAYQYVTKIDANYPYNLKKDELGNQVLIFKFPKIAAHETIIISIKAFLKLGKEPVELKYTKSFLEPCKFIESNSPDIARIAKRFATKNDYNKAEKVYSWVKSNIKTIDFTHKDLGALEALKTRQGDCTEKAYLYTALMRKTGIPCQFVSGYYVEKNAVLSPFDFHNWSSFKTNDKWHVADTQNRAFATTPQNFIAYTIAGGQSQNLMNNKHRYYLTGKLSNNLKVQMK